ncbi:MAG TPA: hypothetical protein VMX16_11660 [Terriglobia bacterium]|nr:hypothetical protein [Terriglobia bacterium]
MPINFVDLDGSDPGFDPNQARREEVKGAIRRALADIHQKDVWRVDIQEEACSLNYKIWICGPQRFNWQSEFLALLDPNVLVAEVKLAVANYFRER